MPDLRCPARMGVMQTSPPDEILGALARMGLLPPGEKVAGEPLTGGVSSDIWRIDLPSGPVCVKRALAKLRVAADWRAPVSRNLYEARWMRRAAAAMPGAVPALLGQDEATGTLAMQFLPAADHPLWKAQLHAGIADPGFAARYMAGIDWEAPGDLEVRAAHLLPGLFLARASSASAGSQATPAR